jgi:predicted ATPase/DNA-binding CsgD family transcriptional regulator
MNIVGRRREVADAKRSLAGARLVMLTGVGGVGKTRLAMRVAAESRRSFPDGVWMVELASLQDAELLPQTVATALGLRDQSVRSPVETLADHLRSKRLLLLMDNCEHLLDACAALTDALLRAADDLRVLATSREPLRIPREVTLEVRPLTVPDPSGSTANEITRYEAVRLFTERAQLIFAGFTLNNENSADVARLCRRLEGIPLAIELAVVRLRVLSLQQILDRLDDRFRLLTKGYRTALPRHRTLRATIDWSFELCSPAEQAVWARASVFAGGFTLEAAEQVCAGGPVAEEEVLDLITSLIDKSVVRRDADARYSQLETFRQYGRERLAETGAERFYRHRHRDHYLNLAHQADANWFGPRQAHWLVGIRHELPNIRVAMDFCLSDPREARNGLALGAALYEYWVFYGAHSEARRWLDRALDQDREPTPVRVEALAVNATIALLQGDLAAAAPLMEECHDNARRAGEDAAPLLIACYYGLASFMRSDLQGVLANLDKAIDWPAVERGLGGDELNDVFLASLYLSMAATLLGDERAPEFAGRCLRLGENAHARWAESWGRWAVGIERWRAGEPATALFRESLRLQYPLDDRWGPVWNTEALAWAAGDDEHAAGVLGVAAALRRSIGVSLAGFPPFAEAHESCTARLREALGDPAYEAAFRRGAALGFGDAVSFALDERPEPPERARPADDLTPRERQVAGLVAAGLSNRDIAARLVISPRTAEAHVQHILVKLGFTSRVEIATWAARDRDES